MKRQAKKLTTNAAALTAVLALAACGGGSSDGDLLSTDNAQGYAADAATMPVSAVDSVDGAVGVLETALGTTTTAAAADVPDQQALALATPQATGSGACAGGGTVAWTVTGPQATLGNGRLDAGETYVATYAGCVTDAGTTFDGTLQVAVTQRDTAGVAFTTTATALRATTAAAVYQLDGSLTEQRTSVTTPVGGTQVTGAVSSNGLTLVTTRGTRQASYQLRSLDWTVVRTYNANGVLQTRTHQGSLDLTASTPRRPTAALAITTQGALTVSSDGFAGAGAFTVRTARDTIACTYGNGSATITLDRGNDGSIDRTWTVQRAEFIDTAG